ncbi:hypothetical protein SBY92_002743 [Candida maltosa Xu316]
MSSNSNPLLVDPSIVTISDKDTSIPINNTSNQSNSQSTRASSIHSLDPSNALSKLLDSAIAHAAKESTPDINEHDLREDEAVVIEEDDDDDDDNGTSSSKKNQPHVYSIGELLQLRGEVEVIDFSGKLPERSFWRLNKTRENSNSQSSSSSTYRKKGRRGGGAAGSGNGMNYNETWERKYSGGGRHGKGNNNIGFSKSQELDNLSSDKISQLLGEQENELDTPEWDDIGHTGNNDHNMGQTVEDFEKWKYQMKLEERKKNGEVIEEDELEQHNNAINAGNEVDNFFSFVKQDDEPQQKAEDKEENIEASDDSNKPHRSSRFSSFFHQPKPDASPVVEAKQTSSQSTPTGPPPGFSKFFSGPPPPPQQQQQQPQPPQQSQQQQQHPQQQHSMPHPPPDKDRHQVNCQSVHQMIISSCRCLIRKNQKDHPHHQPTSLLMLSNNQKTNKNLTNPLNNNNNKHHHHNSNSNNRDNKCLHNSLHKVYLQTNFLRGYVEDHHHHQVYYHLIYKVKATHNHLQDLWPNNHHNSSNNNSKEAKTNKDHHNLLQECSLSGICKVHQAIPILSLHQCHHNNL